MTMKNAIFCDVNKYNIEIKSYRTYNISYSNSILTRKIPQKKGRSTPYVTISKWIKLRGRWIQRACLYHYHLHMFTYGSFTLSLSFVSPMYSDSSWNSILTKIRLELLVSSSFRWMKDNTSQEIASVKRRCAKNLATFRNLSVSMRWIVSYVSLNICWRGGTNNLFLIWQNLCKETGS
jgi:hypothetical protein